MTRTCAWCGNPIPAPRSHIRVLHLSGPAVVLVRRPFPPIGLTAAGLFAGGEVSRADSRVRRPGTFTCARCPAVRSALDAVPEAYHNPAAVWWGPLQLPRSSRTWWSWSLSAGADGRAVDDRLRRGRGHLAAWAAALAWLWSGRLVRLLEGTAWPDSGFLARPLGGAAVDSRLDQRVYRPMQACGQQDLPPAALRVHRRRRVRSAADDLPDPFEDHPAAQPPAIPATMATGLYNNLSIAASLHLVTAQLAMSAPTVNASLAPGRRQAPDPQVS